MPIWKRILFFLILAGAVMAAATFGQDLIAGVKNPQQQIAGHTTTEFIVRDSIIVGVSIIVGLYAAAKVLS
jgi:hypothetical protein